MKYTVEKHQGSLHATAEYYIYCVIPPKKDMLAVYVSESEEAANIQCEQFNDGIAPLHAEIERLKAENTKLEAELKQSNQFLLAWQKMGQELGHKLVTVAIPHGIKQGECCSSLSKITLRILNNMLRQHRKANRP